MKKTKKLPEAEFEVMKVVWANEPPITTNILMQQLGNQKGWRVQTTISLLMRLVKRGFLRTEKTSKERSYFPLVDKDDYLKLETNHFLKLFHDNSFTKLVATMYSDKAISDEDIDDLLEWAKKERG